MEFNGRWSGKSLLTDKFVEYLLDSGKHVLCLSPDRMILKQRVRHLTLLENIQTEEVEPTIFYDDM